MSSVQDPTLSFERPSSWALFWIFSRIGLASFGGGLSGWLMREFVHARRWIGEEEFLNGLAIAQSLPGVNVTNLAVWIGYHLADTRGAVVATLGILVPPAVFVLLLSALFALLSGYPVTHMWLAGAAAAAIGLSLSMAIVAVRRVRRGAVPLAFTLCVFVLVAILRLPLVWVVLGLSPVSVALEYLRLRRHKETA